MSWERPNAGYTNYCNPNADDLAVVVGERVTKDFESLQCYLTALESVTTAVAKKAGIGKHEFARMLTDAVQAEEHRGKKKGRDR